jgi:hypothetical protein
MIQFTKPIQLTEQEVFNPALGTFTLLDGTIIDEQGEVNVKLQFELLQNHQSGNITRRTGVVLVPKTMFDTLQVQYDGTIGDEAACATLLQSYNITDLTT